MYIYIYISTSYIIKTLFLIHQESTSIYFFVLRVQGTEHHEDIR